MTEDFSDVVGNTSTHPEKMSTNMRRYLVFFIGGMCVKSVCQSCPGMCSLAWWVGKEGGLTFP